MLRPVKNREVFTQYFSILESRMKLILRGLIGMAHGHGSILLKMKMANSNTVKMERHILTRTKQTLLQQS